MSETPNFAEQVDNIMTGIRNMRNATDGHYTIVVTSILERDIEQALLTKMRPLTGWAKINFPSFIGETVLSPALFSCP
jgi:hypothetical protein